MHCSFPLILPCRHSTRSDLGQSPFRVLAELGLLGSHFPYDHNRVLSTHIPRYQLSDHMSNLDLDCLNLLHFCFDSTGFYLLLRYGKRNTENLKLLYRRFTTFLGIEVLALRVMPYILSFLKAKTERMELFCSLAS